MPKIRRGNYLFLGWVGDHSPRHVHVYRDGTLIVKWDLENNVAMKGNASRRVLRLIRELQADIDRILEYNRDPSYMRDLLLYKLTIEAKKLVESSPVGIRELGRRLGTSPTQIYRLLDEENTRKSLDRVFELLSVLQCRIDIRSINDPANDAKTGKPVLRLTVHG